MSFPWLGADESVTFPPVEESTEEGIVAAGGNLSPGVLLSAYRQGIFPWFNEGEPILWWSPNPRFILYTDKLKISKSMRKEIKKRKYEVCLDRNFEAVIKGCRRAVRKGQGGTWITEDMVKGYCELNRLGWAHSAEVYEGENLVAGLYGISLGKFFFGESMFTTISNGSKTAFILLTLYLKEKGFPVIDCQQETRHLASLGGESVDRSEFYKILRKQLPFPDYRGNWGELFSDFPDSAAFRDLTG